MESTSGEGEGGHEIELSGGNWQTVVIPVTEALMTTAFSTRTTYTLRGLQAGAVYDVVAKAKNKFGWSDQSKTFNFFNKGVGKSYWWLSSKSTFCFQATCAFRKMCKIFVSINFVYSFPKVLKLCA